MSSDKPNSFKGFLAKRPLLVFVWSVAPILAIFGVTMMNPTLDSTQIIGEQSLLELSMAQLASVVIMLVIPALLIAYLYRGNVFAFFNLKLRPKASHLVLATVLIVSANFFLNYLMELNALIPVGKNFANKFQQLQDSTSQTQAFFLNFEGGVEFLVVFLTMAISPALAEELYFRGLLMGLLRDLRISAFHVIFLSTLLFAMMHFQFYYLLPLLFMGALLGYVYYRTKNLWLSMYMHLLNNGMIVVLTLSNKHQLSQIDLESNPPVWLSIIGLVIFAFGLYILHTQTKTSCE